jgi:CBS domain-containing protein
MKSRLVKDLIHCKGVFVAPPDISVVEAACRMQDGNVGALMIVQSGFLTGIFTERDALFRVIAQGLDPKSVRVDSVMTRNPITVSPHETFGQALRLMLENGFRHVPVTIDGTPVGMLSARDALASEVADFQSEQQRKDSIAEILA